MKSKSDIVKEYCDRFPRHGDRTIARAIMKDIPELFGSFNAARQRVRTVRGNMKDGSGRFQKKAEPAEKDFKKLFTIPEGIRQLGEWGPQHIELDKAIIIADIHLPYHEKAVLDCAVNHGIKGGYDTVILAGDACDFFACSKFESDPRRRDLQNELRIAKSVIREIGRNFEQRIYILGNHEERWEKYLWVKAPELTGVADFQFEKVLDLEGWTVVKNKRPVVIANDLHIVHGHEWGNALTNPVNPARGCYLKSKVNTICGHLHQSSEHSEPDLTGKITTCWSLACSCDLRPEYRPVNKWNHSFGDLTCPTRDSWRFDNKKVIKGHIV